MSESDDSMSQFEGGDEDVELRPPPSVAGYQAHPSSPESGVDDFEQGARRQELPDDQSEAPSWARGADQPSEAGESVGGQSEAPNEANEDDGASVRDDPRALRMGLNEMPGFTSGIMGDDVKKPVPAKYMTGLPGYWAQWSNSSSPFKPGCEPRPARVLCHNIVGEFIAKDAARIGEWETLSDQAARARQVSSAALLGMLTTGTAKGWTCTEEHTELTEAREDNNEGEELDRIRKSLNGNVKTYTYRPHKDDPSKKPEEREMSAMQFGWFLEELYSPDKTKVVAIRILKLIYCSTHSDDKLWGNLMQETSDITRAGNINAIPEALRKPKLMQQNKLQRSQINDEDLENTASTQWKRIDSMSALTKHLQHYAGAGDGSRGRPLYADMAKETPPGCIDLTLREDKKRIKWGGSHPLGPSVALNFKRYVEPDKVQPGHPGVNVAIAGTVDAAGNKIKILPVQCDPNNYFDADGTFRPPDEVVELGAMWACHDNSVKNIFNVPFPRPVHGSVVPEDVLLKSFFELRKHDDKVLRRTQECDPPKEFEQARDATEVAFNSYITERDAVAAAVSKSILNSEMLAYDSIDKTVAEQERLDRRAYETRNVDKVGNVWVLEPRQALRDISLEIERAFGMIDDYDKRERLKIAGIRCPPAERRQAIATRQRLRQKLHCQQVEACIRLGLRRFEHAFSSKKLSGTIPPGWKDICDKGLRKALKEAAEVGIRLSKLGRGRKVNPDDINAKHGTANVAFAHDQGMVRKDLTPWGHWRCFLTHMLSAGIKVQGDQVRLMLEAWIHAFEPCAVSRGLILLPDVWRTRNAIERGQTRRFDGIKRRSPVLTVRLAGMGKSARAMRLKDVLCKGWIVNGANESSAKSGMNGNMDDKCGRCVFYDEVTTDFASADNSRIEYLKMITMEQHANLQRTVKTMGTNGLESFTTVHIETLHFETHMMATNCGPLGVKQDVELATNRQALVDRSFAQIVHAADSKGGDDEFDYEKASIAVKEQINRIRVISCIIAYVLVFIKHLPHCQPNLAYARELTNTWDEIQHDEFNLPKPSRRKKIKRRMLFNLFAAESATVEKLLYKHTAIDFKDMLPDENGNLSAFCIDQLVDVIRSLQRCLDFETILNAWSHNLDHSPPTSSHFFQMKTALAQLHGADLDFRTLVGKMPKPGKGNKPSQPTNTARQGAVPMEEDEDDDESQRPPPAAPTSSAAPATTAAQQAENLEAALNGEASAAPARASAPAPTPAASTSIPAARGENGQFANDNANNADDPDMDGSEAARQCERAERRANKRQKRCAEGMDSGRDLGESSSDEDDDGIAIDPPTDQYGNPACDRVQTKGIMHDGITRRDCGRLAEQLETHRQLRADYTNRLTKRGFAAMPKGNDPDRTALDAVKEAMTDGKNKDGQAIHYHASTSRERDAWRVAAAVMPTTQDVLASGIDDQFLKDVLQGNPSGHFGKPEWHHLLGIRRNLAWEYELVNSNRTEAKSDDAAAAGASSTSKNRLLTPSEFDFNWAIHKSFSKSKVSGEGGATSGGAKRKTVWSNATRMVKRESANARSNFFSLMHLESMTGESMRDTLYMMAQGTPENQVRIPVYNHQQTTLLGKRPMQAGGKKIYDNVLPDRVHPMGMFQDTAGTLTETFANPKSMKRPFDDTIVGTSGYQKRLDHLNKKMALPVAATPVAFTKGVPIKESEQHNGIFFNTWIAREHSNLVVEAATFLSRQPGLAGASSKHAPDTFRQPSSLRRQQRERLERAPLGNDNNGELGAFHEGELVDDNQQSPLPTSQPNDDQEEEVYQAPEDEQQAPPLGEDVEEDENTDAGSNLSDACIDDQDEVINAADAKRVEGDGDAADIRPAEAPVRDTEAGPSAQGPRVATPGVAKVAAAASVEEDALVNSLPFEWDMLQMFLTYKMAGTLHNDITQYVEHMAAAFPDVFKEDIAETIRDLPQMCLRFPGLCDRDAVLQPLSVKLSTTQPEGRYIDLAKFSKKQEHECSNLTKATVHSISNGRLLNHDDSAVLEFEADQRGVANSGTMKGNLFSRSAWQRFTLAQLDRRGMLTDDERERVLDQGICLRQRIAHELSRQGGRLRETLGETQPLPCGSFEARERIKRESGVDFGSSTRRRSRDLEDEDDDLLGLSQPFKKPKIGSYGA